MFSVSDFIDNHQVLSIIVVIAFFLLLFYLTREFWCWYFKINRLVQLLEESNELQSEANELLEKIYNSNNDENFDNEEDIDIKNKNSEVDFSVIYTTGNKNNN